MQRGCIVDGACSSVCVSCGAECIVLVVLFMLCRVSHQHETAMTIRSCSWQPQCEPGQK